MVAIHSNAYFENEKNQNKKEDSCIKTMIDILHIAIHEYAASVTTVLGHKNNSLKNSHQFKC